MTTTLYATPYNIDAAGFYFTNIDDYTAKSSVHFDRHGILVEEYEIQLIDCDDTELFTACGINQSNLNAWFDNIECLADHEKVSLYFLAAVAGYSLDQALDKLDEPSIAECSLSEAAEQLFDECYANEIPDALRFYFDLSRWARDIEIGGDMTEFEYHGTTYTCTNANVV